MEIDIGISIFNLPLKTLSKLMGPFQSEPFLKNHGPIMGLGPSVGY